MYFYTLTLIGQLGDMTNSAPENYKRNLNDVVMKQLVRQPQAKLSKNPTNTTKRPKGKTKNRYKKFNRHTECTSSESVDSVVTGNAFSLNLIEVQVLDWVFFIPKIVPLHV